MLQANTSTQANSQQHSLEQAASGISLYGNTNKTEYMCFNQEDIATLNGGSPKLMDKFMYLRSSISSTENDINMRLVRLIQEYKTGFFPSSSCINSTIWMHHVDID